MKKLLFFIATILLFTLSSCNASAELETFSESTDLIVLGAIVDEYNSVTVAVQNNSEKTIRDYNIAYIGYDASGNYIELSSGNIYAVGTVKSANILPSETYGLSIVSSGFSIPYDGVKYIEATASSITFTDGSTWTASGIDSWANDKVKIFTVDNYNQSIENMKADSDAASKNPYMEIISTEKYSDGHNLEIFNIDVKNISNKNISKFEFLMLEYDQNGYAIASLENFVTRNCVRFIVPENVAPGEKIGLKYDLFFPENVKKFAVIIYEIEFSDGSVWTNPYTFHWLLYNQDLK